MKNNWPTKKLGKIATVDWGNTSITKAFYKPSGYLAVSATGPDGFMDSFENDRSSIILSAIGAKCGKTFWVEGKWTAIKNTIVIFSNNEENYLTKYLYYFLTPNKWKIVGGGQPFITKGAAESVKIPLPPLITQKQIVERLDKIAEAQKLNDDLIQKTDELFQSLLRKELNPAGKNWGVKKLSEVLEINYGKGLDKSKRVDSGKFFAYGSNGPVYRANESLIDNEVIVIGRKGTAGALYFVSEPCWPIDTTFFARPKSDASLKFIYYLLQTKNLPRLAIVTGVPGINRTTLSNINIQLPPLKVQKQIVAKLSTVREYKGRLLEQKSKLKELFESVLHQAFSGKI